MSMQSFPLIGIDYAGNEYPFEHPGVNAKDAAQNGAGLRNYVKVLSGDKTKKLAQYRQLLFESKSTHKNGASPLGHLLEDALVKKGPEILELLRSKGVKVSLVRNPKTQAWSSNVEWPIYMSDSVRTGLRELIQPNTRILVEALKAEQTTPEPKDTPLNVDIQKGKTLREIVLSMLPQMPHPSFTKKDLIDRLKAAGYTALAEQDARIQGALYGCMGLNGEVQRLGRARYTVREEFRHRKAKATPAVPIPVVSIESVVPVEPPTEPIVLVDPGLASILQDVPPQPVAEPESVIAAQPAANPMALLLELASQAVSGTDDADDLGEKITEACQVFVTSMMDAVTAFEAVVKPIGDKLTKQKQARQALIRSLSDTYALRTNVP